MRNKIVPFIFFANYFVGIIALALTFETLVQLQLPFNSVSYYILLFAATVMYYTYAYSGAPGPVKTNNPRTEWYREHYRFIKISQLVLLGISILSGMSIVYNNYSTILQLPLLYWLVISVIPLSALLYYGLLPRSFLNLRNTGWVKAFVIGFVWASCVNLLPLIMLRIEHGYFFAEPVVAIWLFIKNWMFCTVNAIMFDMKDYADDANKQLKTFVVRFGLRKTIFFVLFPLLLVGIASTIVFAQVRHFGILPVTFNLIPFFCLLMLAYSLHRRKKILYYLIVIDGLLLIKAICGIAGMQFITHTP